MKILYALLVLKEQAVNGCVDKTFYGVCYNLSKITGDVDSSYNFVKDNCKDWECFSGNSVFPIYSYYEERLWEGKQLELRLSLIDHLITKAKEIGV